jgi:hypothetical protein
VKLFLSAVNLPGSDLDMPIFTKYKHYKELHRRSSKKRLMTVWELAPEPYHPHDDDGGDERLPSLGVEVEARPLNCRLWSDIAQLSI